MLSLRYLVRRLLHTVLVLLGTSVVIFVLVRLTGDPTKLLVSVDARPEDLERYRAFLGLDRPWYIQYWYFLDRALHGDFGTSFRHHQPAVQLVLERLPATLKLAFSALLLAYTVPVAVGVYSAVRRNSIADFFVRILAVAGQCIPTFWLGIVLILLFSVQLRWFPPVAAPHWRGLVLPAVTLSAYFAATNTRLIRSAVIEVFNKDYVRTARAKGLKEWAIVRGHVLRNAAIPIVTMAGLQFGALMGGAIITETVFAYPGMGLLAIEAIRGRDFPVVQAFVLVVAVFIVTINLFVDLLYSWLDPRIQTG